MNLQSNTIRTIGMDLGDRNHVLCLLDDAGEVVAKCEVVNTAHALRNFLQQFENPALVRVTMESGTHSPWISHLLDSWGFEVLVGNARRLRAIWETDRKDDYRDAEMLARIGRFDPQLLYPIQHRSMEAHADLAVLRARDALMRSRTLLINCARGLVKSEGGRLPKCSAPAFAKKAAEHVPIALAPAINPMLSQIAAMSTQIREYERCVERLCECAYTDTSRMRQVAGVGALTALAFLLTIEDPDRFRKNRSAGPFLGLTPKRDQSADTDKELSISKAGDAYMRRLLTQSANYILGPFGKDCELRRFGQRLAARGGKGAKRRAVTAVARKLAVLLLRLWKTGETYEPLRRRAGNSKDGQETAA
jgi:transposase